MADETTDTRSPQEIIDGMKRDEQTQAMDAYNVGFTMESPEAIREQKTTAWKAGKERTSKDQTRWEAGQKQTLSDDFWKAFDATDPAMMALGTAGNQAVEALAKPSVEIAKEKLEDARIKRAQQERWNQWAKAHPKAQNSVRWEEMQREIFTEKPSAEQLQNLRLKTGDDYIRSYDHWKNVDDSVQRMLAEGRGPNTKGLPAEWTPDERRQFQKYLDQSWETARLKGDKLDKVIQKHTLQEMAEKAAKVRSVQVAAKLGKAAATAGAAPVFAGFAPAVLGLQAMTEYGQPDKTIAYMAFRGLRRPVEHRDLGPDLIEYLTDNPHELSKLHNVGAVSTDLVEEITGKVPPNPATPTPQPPSGMTGGSTGRAE